MDYAREKIGETMLRSEKPCPGCGWHMWKSWEICDEASEYRPISENVILAVDVVEDMGKQVVDLSMIDVCENCGATVTV